MVNLSIGKLWSMVVGWVNDYSDKGIGGLDVLRTQRDDALLYGLNTELMLSYVTFIKTPFEFHDKLLFGLLLWIHHEHIVGYCVVVGYPEHGDSIE